MKSIRDEPHIDITVDEDAVNEGATEIIKIIRPMWPIDKLHFKLFTNGLTNKLVGVWYEGHYNEMVLVRIYGHKTDLLIDRKAETRNIQLIHQAGYTYGIYATFNNGLAYQFLPGDILTVDSVRCPSIYKLVAQRMAQMHKLHPIHPEISTDPCIWQKTEKFMNIMPKSFPDANIQAKFGNLIQPYQVLNEEYQLLKDVLSQLGSDVVFAHNDLLLGNVLYDETKNSVTFIDYEYTAYNYQAFDIANHFAEFVGVDVTDYSLYPNESLQRDWLKFYLEEYNATSDVSTDAVTKLYKQVNKFVLLSHFFWGCWSLIQAEHSAIDFDFLEYASIRFGEYFKRKEEFLAL